MLVPEAWYQRFSFPILFVWLQTISFLVPITLMEQSRRVHLCHSVGIQGHPVHLYPVRIHLSASIFWTASCNEFKYWVEDNKTNRKALSCVVVFIGGSPAFLLRHMGHKCRFFFSTSTVYPKLINDH